MSSPAGDGARGTGRDATTYRPGRPDDLPACTRIWRAAIADYLGRLNADDGLPFDLGPLHRLLAHLLATDPERFWMAVRPHPTEGEQAIGFAAAIVRGHTWFLAMLFVHPAEQRNGVGRTLLERAMDGADGRVLGTATDTAQPISIAMYSRLGIVARMPCLHLTGRPASGDALPGLPPGVVAVPFARVAGDGSPDAPGQAVLDAAVAAIDTALLGYERPQDHAWLRGEGRRGWLYRDAAGHDLGYGYVAPVGRVGPVAAIDRRDLLAFVGHLLHVVEPAGVSGVWVPGAAGDVVSGLLRAGFRLEPFPALFHWSSPLADFERYLPISLAIV